MFRRKRINKSYKHKKAHHSFWVVLFWRRVRDSFAFLPMAKLRFASGKPSAATLVRVAFYSSNPYLMIKNTDTPMGICIFWRRVRDSIPRYLSVSLVFKTSSSNRSDNSPRPANDTIGRLKSQGKQVICPLLLWRYKSRNRKSYRSGSISHRPHQTNPAG